MSELPASWFDRQFLAIRAWRVPILIVLAALVVAAVAGAGRLPFTKSVEVMLPDGEARDAIRFLTETTLADKVVVSLEKVDPALSQEDFVRASDQLAAALRSPLLQPVETAGAAGGMVDNFTQLLDCAPQLFEPADLTAAQAAVAPLAIDRSVRTVYRDLASPGSLFTGRLARHDPLGITRSILGRLDRLSAANLYDINVEDGHLFSSDHHHLLLVFTTPVAVTDSAGSRDLIALLDAQCRSLPASVRADVVCGHLHTAGNERVIKSDIQRTSWIGAIAFILIFAGVFRDWRSVAMLGIPICTALLALPLAAFCHSQLSYIVIGFGMVIVGISSDYGIYVYVVTRRSGQPAAAVRRIVRPMGLGMLTTLAVFVAFYFSGIEGYRQLATFAIFSIALAYLAAIFILPHLLGDRHCRNGDATREPIVEPTSVAHPALRVLVAGIALALGIAMVSRGFFNTDITQLDGVGSTVLDAEARFEKTWSAGASGQGVLAVTGATYEEALARSESIYTKASAKLGGRLLSFSTLWPSASVRAANLARWNAFWTPARISAVQSQLIESGKRNGFTPAAFQPFFDRLRTPATLAEPSGNALFNLIKDRFVHKSPTGYTVFSFFPDNSECTGLMSALARRVPGAYCVSSDLLTTSLAASIGHTIRIVTAISLTLVLALTFLLSPNWRLALIALFPSVVAVLWALGIPAVTQHTLTICHVTAAAVVFGLCTDYGIYMTHGLTHGLERQSRTTIILTTATSIIGAGVLLFTKHPVLFAIGLTLTVGMLVGHVVTIWVVPALYSLWGRSAADRQTETISRPNSASFTAKAHRTSPVAFLILLFLLCAMGRPASAEMPSRYSAISSVVIQYRWIKFPALGVMTVDTAKRNFALVGMSQIGVNVFELSDTNGHLHASMPGKLLQRRPQLAAGAAADVENLFFDLTPPPHPRPRSDRGTVEYRFDAKTGLLTEKRLIVPGKWLPGRSVDWLVRYEDYRPVSAGKTYPRVIRFKQRRLNYAITIFLKEIRTKP